MDPFRIPLDAIRIKPNIPKGLNTEVLIHLVHVLRTTNADPPPVRVVRLACGGYRLMDGRHRFLSAVIAGRRDILATYERTDT